MKEDLSRKIFGSRKIQRKKNWTLDKTEKFEFEINNVTKMS